MLINFTLNILSIGSVTVKKRELIMKGKTNLNFDEALYELKLKNDDISYGKIALGTGILECTINALVNRKRTNPPDDEIIIKIAKYFNIDPSYFYEWRKTKFLEFLDTHRDFLDFWPTIAKTYKNI